MPNFLLQPKRPNPKVLAQKKAVLPLGPVAYNPDPNKVLGIGFPRLPILCCLARGATIPASCNKEGLGIPPHV